MDRPRLTTEIYRDILEDLEAALEVLEIEQANTDDDKLTQDEKAANESIQYVLRSAVNVITLELP